MPERPDQLTAIGLAIAKLDRKFDQKLAALETIEHTLNALLAGQGRVAELLEMVGRTLTVLVQSVAQEPDGENLADLLRTILVQLGATTQELRLALQKMAEMPGEVANVLHADGLIAEAEC